MDILAVDIGGSCVKLRVSHSDERREFDSGRTLTAQQMVDGVRKAAAEWHYEAVSIGYPGVVLHNRPMAEPANLGDGWVGFGYEAAFGRPVKIINDAAPQALGSYRGDGRMLFLGFGTGLGSALVTDRLVEPIALGHLPYKESIYDDYIGQRGLDRYGKEQWQQHVAELVKHFTVVLDPDEIVLGGGNVRLLDELPPRCRAGDNDNAFIGGFRLWEAPYRTPAAAARRQT